MDLLQQPSFLEGFLYFLAFVEFRIVPDNANPCDSFTVYLHDRPRAFLQPRPSAQRFQLHAHLISYKDFPLIIFQQRSDFFSSGVMFF